MRRSLLAVGAMVWLAACQQSLDPQSSSFADLRPIEGQIVLGSASVGGAVRRETWKQRAYSRYGDQLQITTTTEARISVSRKGGTVSMQVAFTEADVDFDNMPWGEGTYYVDVRNLKGTSLDIEYNAHSGTTLVSVEQYGVSFDRVDRRTHELGKQLAREHFGGLIVRQRKKLPRLFIGSFSTPGEPEIDLFVGGTVRGETMRDGRRIVVVMVDDVATLFGNTVEVKGHLYLDVASGLSIKSDYVVSGIRHDGGSNEFDVRRDVTIE